MIIRKLLFLLLVSSACFAAEPAPDQPIGDIASWTRQPNGILLQSNDGSQVAVQVLASDLIRVRASIRAPLAVPDHSWAIAKTDWAPTKWDVSEAKDAIELTTSELRVRVQRQPVLIDIIDAQTGRSIVADQQPMTADPKCGKIAAYKRLGFNEHFYGLGEKAAPLDKRRGSFTMWNSDTPAYKLGTDPIYQSIPFYLGWNNGAVYGLFFDNSYKSFFDFGRTAQDHVTFGANGGEINYYVFWGPSAQKVIARYTELTGRIPLPPKYALGNQQSRYSYYSDQIATDVIKRYRADDLPLDVITLDIHYMDGFRVFTWNPKGYPNPEKFCADAAKENVKVVTIVDPGVKYQPHDATDPKAPSYSVFDDGLKHDYFLRRSNGQLYIARVWPGDAVFVDYTKPEAAKWWGDQFAALLNRGVSGIWTDMNEPSDFLDMTGDSQANVVFYDEGTHSPYAKNRNVFALGMARATYEGLQRLEPNRRPFVITRAGYAGIQRYSTMWMGDNNSTWDALALTIPMMESLGLSGEVFVGSDIPGFMGRADGELMVRWYQAAFLSPFFRNHAEANAYDHEPWRFGPYYEGLVRNILKWRYRMLPYLYTELANARDTGLPLFRPLLLNYQNDENTIDLDDQYMVGDSLLAAPVLTPNTNARRVYLPEGVWYDFWRGERLSGSQMINVTAGLDATPLYVRGGTIIPIGEAMKYVGEKPSAPITWHVYPDAKGAAKGDLYEDDGDSPAYLHGAFRRTTVTYRTTSAEAVLELSATGEFSSPVKTFEFVLHGVAAPTAVSIDGTPMSHAENPSAAGWLRDGDVTRIRIPVDQRSHRIELR